MDIRYSSTCGVNLIIHLCRILLQMGRINPAVRLYVVTLDGSSRTTELRPPDSFEKRFNSSTSYVVSVNERRCLG